jgi:AraC family transcriptional regulator
MEALLRAARIEHSLRPDYISRLADALLCHLSQWVIPAASRQPALPPLVDTTCAAQKIGNASLRELLDYIDSRLGSPLPLNELAAHAGISRAAFTRDFRLATGLSAHQYLTKRRVSAAMHLLHESDLELAHIAQETGFSSQSHFTDTFHAVTGVTPRRYREQRSEP